MRKELWNSMLDADLNARYWNKLSKRYSVIDRNIKIFLALLSSGTVAGWQFWKEMPFLWKTLSCISALVSIILPIIKLPKLISKMSDLTGRWLQLKSDYEILWTDYNSNSNNQQLPKRFKDIKNREVSAKKVETDLPREDSKLIKDCYLEVLKSRGL